MNIAQYEVLFDILPSPDDESHRLLRLVLNLRLLSAL